MTHVRQLPASGSTGSFAGACWTAAAPRGDDLQVLRLDVRRAVGREVVLRPQPRQVAPQRGLPVLAQRGEGAQRRPVPLAEEVDRLLRRQGQAEGDRAAVEVNLGDAVAQTFADGRL